ncbi:MAG: iron-containing alcohol dehydrogenase [Pseudomonadota bacterium]
MSFPGYTLRLPRDIRFGRGVAKDAVPDIAALGARLFLVQGGSSRGDWLVEALKAEGAEVETIQATGEPDLAGLEAAVAQARAFGPDAVVSYGGGAVVDLGKAVAGLVRELQPAQDYLEVVGTGQKLTTDPVPFVAIPTTAGTGAEVTKNAVIGVPSHRRKVSLRDDRMLARMAIVDPSLTDGTPWEVTRNSGLDACVQVIEPYLCSRANPVTDAICAQAIPVGLKAVATLAEGEDPDARDELANVSLMGGVALANAGLGAVHGLAGPLGGVTPAPHGAICGRLLPAVLSANGSAIPADTEVAKRIDQVNQWIATAFGVSGPEALATWLDDRGLPRLSAMGLADVDIPDVAEAALGSSSMKANPVQLTAGDLDQVLRASF